MSRSGSARAPSVAGSIGDMAGLPSGFVTPSRSMPDSPDESPKRKRYYLEQAAAAKDRADLYELKAQVAAAPGPLRSRRA